MGINRPLTVTAMAPQQVTATGSSWFTSQTVATHAWAQIQNSGVFTATGNWVPDPVLAATIVGDHPWTPVYDQERAIAGVNYKNLFMPLSCISRLVLAFPDVLSGWTFLDPRWQQDLYHLALRELIVGV